VQHMNKGRIRHVLMATTTTLVLVAGLVVAAQTTGRAELSSQPTTLERHPLWVPGSDVPMATYLQSDDASLPAPPR
jgi:hypothetical protein